MTTTFIQSTTNPIVTEVGVEFFHKGDALHWIPSGFAMVEFVVDADDLDDDRSATLECVAEEWCKSQGVVFSQVIESDLW